MIIKGINDNKGNKTDIMELRDMTYVNKIIRLNESINGLSFTWIKIEYMCELR